MWTKDYFDVLSTFKILGTKYIHVLYECGY